MATPMQGTHLEIGHSTGDVGRERMLRREDSQPSLRVEIEQKAALRSWTFPQMQQTPAAVVATPAQPESSTSQPATTPGLGMVNNNRQIEMPDYFSAQQQPMPQHHFQQHQQQQHPPLQQQQQTSNTSSASSAAVSTMAGQAATSASASASVSSSSASAPAPTTAAAAGTSSSGASTSTASYQPHQYSQQPPGSPFLQTGFMDPARAGPSQGLQQQQQAPYAASLSAAVSSPVSATQSPHLNNNSNNNNIDSIMGHGNGAGNGTHQHHPGNNMTQWNQQHPSSNNHRHGQFQHMQDDVAQPGHSIPGPSAEAFALHQNTPLPAIPAHELQTPSEFALKMLFTQFVRMAETKLNLMLALPLQDSEPDLLSPLKEGVDPKFDKLLASLGSVARHRPKPVIDCVMLWRKGKVEGIDESSKSGSGEWSFNYKGRDPRSVAKERKTMVSLFIMSRSLIEIVKQIQPGTLPNDLGYRLEETVFSQLENVDPEFIQRSPNRIANINVLVELMGSLSNVRFATVSDRFIVELERFNKAGIQGKDKDRENRMEMLIRGMRFLNLKLYPMDCLEDTADFLQSCARFFKSARGIKIKHAYAELFVQLLTPIAKVALAEVNHPNWSQTVELIYPKARSMCSKPRHMQVAYPLVTMLLCVSKKDFFLKHWVQVFDQCRDRFKDKSMRHIVLNCISQIVWVLYFRCGEGDQAPFKNLDYIAKNLLPTSKRGNAMLDGYIGQFVKIVHFIGLKYANETTRTIIFVLLNLESMSNTIFTNLTLDMISPERMTVGIQAFMRILADVEKGGQQQPPFPTPADPSSGPGSPAAEAITSDLLDINIIKRAGLLDSYEQVSAALGKIAIVMDRNYGHTLISDEKYTTPRSMFSAAAIMATATGDLNALVVHSYSTFAVSYSKDKQPYFDLMRSWVLCLPRCMPSGIPRIRLVEMLSRYTTHVDPELRKASAAALVRIARQCSPQTVLAGYAGFVTTVEDRLSELLSGLVHVHTSSASEGGVLSIYISVLEAWIEGVSKPAAEEPPVNPAALRNMMVSPIPFSDSAKSGSHSHSYSKSEVDIGRELQTTEQNGLLFLCSQQPAIRKLAIRILHLAAQIEQLQATLEGRVEAVATASVSVRPKVEQTRILHLLQNTVTDLFQVDENGNALPDCTLAMHELIRLQNHHQKGPAEVLSLLAESEHEVDVALWRHCFPLLITKIFQQFPKICEPCLEVVCKRTLQLYPAIVTTTDTTPNTTLASKFSIKSTQAATEDMVEQWRMYLIFICSTMVRHEHQSPAAPGHGRKRSAPTDKISCARDLFRLVLPLLNSDRASIRDSVVNALGRINVRLYKALLEDLQPFLYTVHDDFRSKTSLKPPYQGKKNKKVDRLRAEIAHILDLTAPLLVHEVLVHDRNIMKSLMGYVKETLLFLLDPEAQHEWEYAKLRTHFCWFVCHLHNGISQMGVSDSHMPFDLRVALFQMFEDWCGYGPNSFFRESDHKSFWYGLDLNKDDEAQANEKATLEAAALSAMASLCQGPINDPHPHSHGKHDRNRSSFNIVEVFRWIESVFASPDTKLHAIAQRALEALLVHNQDHEELIEDAIHQCYAGDHALKFTQGHFSALVDIVIRIESFPCQLHQILSLALFKCGDPNIATRALAIKLLKVIEGRYFPSTCAGEYEIGIVNKLPTIYRQAQYVLSARLGQDRPDQTYSLLTESMMRFDIVSPDCQSEMLYYITPWLANVELVLDEDDELSQASYVILVNLFFLTIKYGDFHVKEIENLWVQLVSGEDFTNVRPIIVFLLDLGLEKRSPGFVDPAKKVIVFIGRTMACQRMVELLISEITPKAMVPKLKQERNHLKTPLPSKFILADLDEVIGTHARKPAFSRGQLATVLLVDLAVEAGAELRHHLPLLLQALFVQLDHYTALICDQTRYLLIHLIHSIIIRESGSFNTIAHSNDLVEFLNSKEGMPMWAHDDISTHKVTRDLESLVFQCLELFQTSEPDIRQQWGETALQWATACPVRHIACRSFQIFRTLVPSFNQHMLSDMLARLSNTIADRSQEIQAFAMEILISLQSVIEIFDDNHMAQFPQIFWTAVACLYTGHDQEYLEGLKLMDSFTSRLDLMDDNNLEIVLTYFPEQWEDSFAGIQPLLLKGLRSVTTDQISLQLLRRLIFASEVALVDPSKDRVVFLFLGILPLLEEGLDAHKVSDDCMQWANDLVSLAERDGLTAISHLLGVYAKQRFRNKEDFWRQSSVILREMFVPELQAEVILFFMRLLYNSHDRFKHNALRCLRLLLPLVDTSRQEFLEIGPELVLPLLQLLQTEYASAALEVLDAAMSLSDKTAESFKIRVPADTQSPGINLDELSTGIFGGGTGLEPRSVSDGWSEPRREKFSGITRANVNAVMLTCTGTGYWGMDVELLGEYDGANKAYVVPPSSVMDFTEQDMYYMQGMQNMQHQHQQYGSDNGVMDNQDQYGHLVSALDDLTEHFTESSKVGMQRKRDSFRPQSISLTASGSQPSQRWSLGHQLQNQSGTPRHGLGLDIGEVPTLNTTQSTKSGANASSDPTIYSRGHHRGGRSSNGGSGSSYLMSHPNRILEDDEEESTLMAAEILKKTLSTNRSYSSLRSTFLMDLTQSGMLSPSFEAPTSSSGYGHKSGSHGRRSGAGGSKASSHYAHSHSSQSSRHSHQHHHHGSTGSGSGGAGAIDRMLNMQTPTGGHGSAGKHPAVSGHKPGASYDNLSLSSSDDDDNDDLGDDSTDSDEDDEDDYEMDSHYNNGYGSNVRSLNRQPSIEVNGLQGRFERASMDSIKGGVNSHSASANASGATTPTTAKAPTLGRSSRMSTTSASGSGSGSVPGSQPTSRPGSQASSSRPGSMPGSPSNKRVTDYTIKHLSHR